MPHIDKDIQKEAVKAAIQEWLDDKYKELGRWTLRGLAAATLALLAYYYLVNIVGYTK